MANAFEEFVKAGQGAKASGSTTEKPQVNSFESFLSSGGVKVPTQQVEVPQPSQPIQAPQIQQPQAQPNVFQRIGQAFTGLKTGISQFGKNVQKEGLGGAIADLVIPTNMQQPEEVQKQNFQTWVDYQTYSSPQLKIVEAMTDMAVNEVNRVAATGAAIQGITNKFITGKNLLTNDEMNLLKQYDLVDQNNNIKVGKTAVEQMKTTATIAMFFPQVFAPVEAISTLASGGKVFKVGKYSVPLANIIRGTIIGGSYNTLYTPNLEKIFSDPRVGGDAAKRYLTGATIGGLVEIPISIISNPTVALSTRRVVEGKPSIALTDAELQDLKSTYLSLAKKYHPDAPFGSDPLFAEIANRKNAGDLQWIKQIDNMTPSEVESFTGFKLKNVKPITPTKPEVASMKEPTVTPTTIPAVTEVKPSVPSTLETAQAPVPTLTGVPETKAPITTKNVEIIMEELDSTPSNEVIGLINNQLGNSKVSIPDNVVDQVADKLKARLSILATYVKIANQEIIGQEKYNSIDNAVRTFLEERPMDRNPFQAVDKNGNEIDIYNLLDSILKEKGSDKVILFDKFMNLEHFNKGNILAKDLDIQLRDIVNSEDKAILISEGFSKVINSELNSLANIKPEVPTTQYETIAGKQKIEQVKIDLQKAQEYNFKYKEGDKVTDTSGKKYIVANGYIENGKPRYVIYTPGKKGIAAYQVTSFESELQPTKKVSLIQPKKEKVSIKAPARKEVESKLEVAPITYTEKDIRAFGKKLPGVEELKTKPVFQYGGRDKNIFSDGFFLIRNDKQALQKIWGEIDTYYTNKLLKSLEKTNNSLPANQKLSDKELLTEVNRQIESDKEMASRDKFPDIEFLLKEPMSSYELAKPTVIAKPDYQDPSVILEGKEIKVAVNADKFSYLKSLLPDHKVMINSNVPLEPVRFVKDGNITAVLMPLNKSQNEIDNILSKIKIQQKPSAPSGKAFMLPTKEDTRKTKLKQEATKYKNINDFIKAQGKPIYHGTNAVFQVFDKSKIGTTTDQGLYGRGFYFGNTESFARVAPRGRLAKYVMEVYIPGAKLFDIGKIKSIKEMANLLNMSEDALMQQTDGIVRPKYDQIGQFTSHLQDIGYDGVVIKRGGDAIETVIFEPETIKTRQQLENIWKQSHLQKAPSGKAFALPEKEPSKIVKVSQYTETGKPGKFWTTPEGADMGYGDIRKDAYLDINSPKIFKYESSYKYIKDTGLLSEKVKQELVDAENSDNPNLVYKISQDLAEESLTKLGYGGAYWTYEDDLNPTQYQIWDKSLLKTKKTTRKAPSGKAFAAPVETVTPEDTGTVIEKLPENKDAYASYNEAETALQKSFGESINHIKPIEMPELVEITQKLFGTPSVKLSMGNKLGVFRGIKGISLSADIFKYPYLARMVLAHELGHGFDFLPEGTMSRGNILGRIGTLTDFTRGTFSSPEVEKQIDELIKQKKQLQQQRRDIKGLNKKAEDKVLLTELRSVNKQIDNLKVDAIKNKEIRDELRTWTKYWTPFDDSLDTPYRKYRWGSDELYAQAMSGLMTSPLKLEQIAPKFTTAFFENLDRKPEVKKLFNEIQNRIFAGEDEILKRRNEKIDEMFSKGEKAFTAKAMENEQRKNDLLFQIKYLFNDKNQRVIDNVARLKKKGIAIDESLRPDYALEELNYLDPTVKNFIQDNFVQVYKDVSQIPNGWNELGKVLMLERAANERGEMANPGGFDPETAKKQIQYIKNSMSEKDWSILQDSLSKFREGVQKANEIAGSGKYKFYKPEMLEEMKANKSYATFQVVDYLDNYISPAVYKSVGTLKDIANPATSTIMKMISVRKAVERNNIKNDVVDFHLQYFPESSMKAETRWNGKYFEPIEPKDPDLALVKVIRDGKIEGFYLDKYVASTINYMNNDIINILARLSRYISGSPFYRPIFTSINPGFQTFNAVRDFQRLWKGMPDKTLGEALKSFWKISKEYVKAVKPAIARAKGEQNQVIKEMENAKILGMTYNDTFGEPTDDIKQIERTLQKVGINVSKGELDKSKIQKVQKAFVKLMDSVEFLGNVIETLPKVAGYKVLKGSMPEKELAHLIRTKAGSPDFRRTGVATPITNNIFMFSNAIKEGYRADFNTAFDPKTRAGFWWKTLILNILPQILKFAATLGVFGYGAKQMYDKQSEYEKSNYITIPYGIDKNGKVGYIRIPQDEAGRFVSSLTWKILNLADGQPKGFKDFTDIFAFGAGQFPTLSPNFTGMNAVIQYLSGQNPYDTFRGRNILTDTEFKAGQKDVRYSLVPFLEWLAQNQGLGIVMPDWSGGQDRSTMNNMQKITTLPLVSNIIGRWVKYSNYGETEKLKDIQAEIDAINSIENIDDTKRVEKAVQEYNKGDKSQSSFDNLSAQLGIDVIGDRTKPDIQRYKNIQKKFKLAVIRGKSDAKTNALVNATSNEAKALILNEIGKTMDQKEFSKYQIELLKEGVISADVISKMQTIKK